MVTLEAVVSFVVWVAYGWTVWRRGPQIRKKYGQIEKNKRILASIWLMIGGLIVLMFGMYGASQFAGTAEGSLSPVGWLIVAAVGCVFVHAQTLAAAIMTTLMEREVTSVAPQSSTIQEKEGLES
ncbi:MAG: hypothetical protein KF784_04270 [Fimbriimonadaceae bacterium]|nr:hypothetical protein [Fimbriimonadaceae bacterium]